ncbi:MAG: hypothetical protein Q9199_000654 [Rusavskia elegans]
MPLVRARDCIGLDATQRFLGTWLNGALKWHRQTPRYPDKPTVSVAEDPEIQYPPNIVPYNVVETTFLRLVNLFDSATVTTSMSVRSSACSIPPEVISIILGQVTDAKTFTACTKVSKTIQDLCQQRPLFMDNVAVTVPLDMGPGVDFRARILSSGRQMHITFDANGCCDKNIYRSLAGCEFQPEDCLCAFLHPRARSTGTVQTSHPTAPQKFRRLSFDADTGPESSGLKQQCTATSEQTMTFADLRIFGRNSSQA